MPKAESSLSDGVSLAAKAHRMSAKIIELKRERTADVFTNKVPIEKLQGIWNDETVTYTDEELIRLREWIYALSEVIIAVSNNRNTPTQIIPLNTATDETAESHSLRPGEYRRAS